MIKQPTLFFVSGFLLAVAVTLTVERAIFVALAVEAEGSVTAISAENGRCGSSRRKHDCTEFTAHIQYLVDGHPYETTTSAGSSSGWDRPATGANHHVGERLPVLYSPADPGRGYRDSFFDLWMYPLFAYVAQIATLIGAFREPGQRR